MPVQESDWIEIKQLAVRGTPVDMSDYDFQIRRYPDGFYWSWDNWATKTGPFRSAATAWRDWNSR